MNKETVVLFLFLLLIGIGTGCSQKLPYAVSEEQYKIFYIAPEIKDDKFWDYFQWVTEFHQDNQK
ncbi:hypothetical protein H1D32_16915 [Anaerobacillus sp. CMMVII]|uniref:hypothetical protein n=1 Tax=Anaerobacillus sp. CMMVII TaxID=2755588 RepID=UPI0021B787C1|nr:hypothetical protein [Anaerobacillus sp. CMMVII]MCT8139235.1 hypothetical protein [Anaerobacillus sp. CMMVII]